MQARQQLLSDCLDQISEKRWHWCLGCGVSGVGSIWSAPASLAGHAHRWQGPSPGPAGRVDGCCARTIALQAASPEQSVWRQGARRWCLNTPAFYCAAPRGLDWNFEAHLIQSPLCNRWNPKKSSSLPKFLQLITKLEWEDSLPTYVVKLY